MDDTERPEEEIDPRIREYLSDSEDEDPSAFDERPVVIVDGLPKVPASKVGKLVGFVGKIMGKVGEVVEGGISMPTGSDGATLGFTMVHFADARSAIRCRTTLNGHRFDKAHTLSVYAYSDLSHTNVPDEIELPEMPEYEERSDYTSWLSDPRMRDQFVTRFDGETEVLWMEPKGRPVLDYGGEREKASGAVWTERAVMWSPKGTYLLTFAGSRGCVLWGGARFEKLGRFPHENIVSALWSPCERYLVTWSGSYRPARVEEALIVWDVRTCTELRRLSQLDRESDICDAVWSQDGQFLARLAQDSATRDVVVKVYETPEMKLQGKSSVRASNARAVSWAPAGRNIAAWWAPESTNCPASCTVMEFPRREILRQKNLFNVQDPQLLWHPDGSYLCLQALHLTKAQMKRKKARDRAAAEGKPAPAPESTVIATAFELFCLKEKGYPVEVLEINENVVHFAWEPKGDRFSVVHGTGAAHRYTVSFYSLKGGKLELLYTLEDKQCNQVVWSPCGGTCVLAGLDNLSGQLEFYDVDGKRSYLSQEHMQCNIVSFDPSGRFVASAKAQPMVHLSQVAMRDTVENGFMLWTFQGTRIHEEGKARLFQFMWRPRPRSLLTDKEETSVKKNLKSYINRYVQQDKDAARRRRFRGLVDKRRQRDAFRSRMASLRSRWESEADERSALGVFDEDDGVREQVDKFNQILSQKVEQIAADKM